MEHTLAQNIKKFRKEKKLTQEQLAEAMGVTLGAVYKWESGQSIPELDMIIRLADFFDTSTDILIGYEWRSKNISRTVEELKQLHRKKEYEHAANAAKKALCNYPNCFAVVYECAQIFYEKANLHHTRSDYEAALKQLDRACELIEQNTDETISECEMRNQTAQLYFALGDTDTCIEILKRYNSCGINDAKIGCILADSYHETEKARQYLERSFDRLMNDLDAVIVGFGTVFWQEKDYDSLLSSVEWLRTLMRGQECSSKVTWFDKYDCVLLALEAEICCVMQDHEAAKAKLEKAAFTACRFDSAAEIETIQLFSKMGKTENRYMNYGKTALEAIERRVMTDAQVVLQLAEIWQQVKAEVLKK